MKTEYLELKNMLFHAYHGIMDQEREVGNSFSVDLKLFFDITKSIQSDDIHDTVDYALVYQVVDEEMNKPSALIEHVAGRILNSLHAAFPQLEAIEIRLAKHNPPVGGDMQEAAVVLISPS